MATGDDAQAAPTDAASDVLRTVAERRRLAEHLLVLRAQTGERAALAGLHRSYDRRLRGYLRSLLQSPADAEDVLQDVWVQVLRKIATLDDPAAFRSWIFAIARNRAWSRLRRRRDLALEEAFEGDDAPRSEVDLDAFEPLDLTADRVQRALAGLGPSHREVVVLRHFEGARYDEIAAVVGCSPGTVRSRLHYARRTLRRLLSGPPAEPERRRSSSTPDEEKK
ncbi:MAG: sigma-70 family RNA polymerase sigma factor [Acidobacteriota bacterium]